MIVLLYHVKIVNLHVYSLAVIIITKYGSYNWRQHFYNILISNDCDEAMKDDIMGNFENIQLDPDMVVSANCISQIIAKLE